MQMEQMEELCRQAAKLAKTIAVVKYKAGDLAGAKELAVMARTLDPELVGLKRLNAVLDLLIGFERKINGEPDWYAVLSVEPTVDVATIHSSYKRLLLDILNDSDDDSVGSIDQAKQILVDSWKFLCDEKRKKLYEELRNLRRGVHEEQERIRRASQLPSLTCIPLPLPKPPQRRFEPPRRLSQKDEHKVEVKAEALPLPPLRVYCPGSSQFPSLPLALSSRKPAVKSQRLFHPPEMFSRENEQKAEEVKAEQMVQERKAPPLTNVIHHVNKLRRIIEEAEIRAINRRHTNLMNSQDVLRRPLARKAKTVIKNLGLETYVPTASRQAYGGSDASATKIFQESKSLKRESKNTNDVVVKEEVEEPYLEVMNVPDPDFYNFDDDRTEASFRQNQVWAAYDDYDGMPRLYALVHSVVSREPFKLCISWLNSTNNEELGPMKWIDSGFYKTSGCFSVGRLVNNESLNSFSHRVQWTKGENNFVQIYPKRGDAWALYANFSPSWSFETLEEVVSKYVMVEVIQGFDEVRGVAVAPLAKVPGFQNVFRRLPYRKTFLREELFRFSHQVPSRLLTGQEYSQEGENAPEGCLELDPAALSMELLNVFAKEETKNSENVFKKPKEEVLETMNNAQVHKMKEEKKD